MEHISTKKLESVLSSQKPSNEKASLGYIGEGSSSNEPKKEVKFVLAKNVEKPKVKKPIVEKSKVEIPTVEKKVLGSRPMAKKKSLPKSQRGPQVKHFCHHCGI